MGDQRLVELLKKEEAELRAKLSVLAQGNHDDERESLRVRIREAKAQVDLLKAELRMLPRVTVSTEVKREMARYAREIKAIKVVLQANE